MFFEDNPAAAHCKRLWVSGETKWAYVPQLTFHKPLDQEDIAEKTLLKSWKDKSCSSREPALPNPIPNPARRWTKTLCDAWGPACQQSAGSKTWKDMDKQITRFDVNPASFSIQGKYLLGFSTTAPPLGSVQFGGKPRWKKLRSTEVSSIEWSNMKLLRAEPAMCSHNSGVQNLPGDTFLSLQAFWYAHHQNTCVPKSGKNFQT